LPNQENWPPHASPDPKCKEPVNLSLSAFGAARRGLILSAVHIRMEFDLFEMF
jgi:hypothetical protein